MSIVRREAPVWESRMSLVIYPMLVSDAAPAELAARFPDVAGLAVRAASPAELLLRAREALLERLHALETAGEAWPPPSSLAAVRAAHPGVDDAIVWVDIEVEDTPVRVTISLGERLLARIDQAAGELAMTRSGYLAASARRQMASGRSPLETPGDHRLLEEVAAAGRRIQETLGPQSPVGRTLAELDAMALDGLRQVSDALRGRRPAPKSPPGEPAAEREAGDPPANG